MTWRDELAEAVERAEEDVRYKAEALAWEWPWPLVVTAVRAVLDGRDVWWCEEHDSGLDEERRFCDFWRSHSEAEDCRMKQVRIIDIPEGGQRTES